MILHDVYVYGLAEKKDIHIGNGKILAIVPAGKEMPEKEQEQVLNLNGATVYPGFINSHDHLDFNLYPQLGNVPYQNYTEWGEDIHQSFSSIINAVKKVPETLRINWGLYKNLLNGFTTVVNHGKKIKCSNDIVNIFQQCHSLHSVSFEKNWRVKLNNPFASKKPYVIHAGEGTDKKTGREVDKLIRSNFFHKKMVAVHGVAMDERQAAAFKGLVWCPASNFFLFNRTAAIDRLKNKVKIVFGTDSTLTAPWDMKDHLAMAMKSGMVDEKELIAMLTMAPALLWNLDTIGAITEGKTADMVIREGNGLTDSTISLVIRKGELMILNETVLGNTAVLQTKNFTHIKLHEQVLWVKGDLRSLVAEILSYYPSFFIPFEIL